MRTFYTTDTHGELDRLLDCFVQANFDYENDTLIHGGDCVDRGPNSWGVIEELLKIKKLISLRGNHDQWMLDALIMGHHPAPKYFQETAYSYRLNRNEYPETANTHPDAHCPVPRDHRKFLENQRNYYVDDQNRLFVHAGFDPMQKIEDQDGPELYWNRTLAKKAMTIGPNDKLNDINDFKQVFIGHTQTINWNRGEELTVNSIWTGRKKPITTPIYKGQIVLCDTGGVYGGKISLLDITTDEHILYQS